MLTPKDHIQTLFDLADVQINGSRPWDIVVRDDRFYRRVLSQGSVGLGESYMDGWWDSPALDKFFFHVLHARLDERVRRNWPLLLLGLSSRLFNRQSRGHAFEIGERHYDIGNDLYSTMLDRRLTYTCGYWKGASDLDYAQENKLELVCKKLHLQPDQTVLDIGCGWGSFAKYAAEKYNVSVVGISVSREQIRLGKKLCHGLPVDLRYQDYRAIKGTFDHIVSLGMFEHVGVKNYKTFMDVVHRSLNDDGLFLLHTIGGDRSAGTNEPWIEKHIFPNSMLPSVQQIARATEGIFVMEDWHNFSADYDKTLMAWHQNFVSHWETLRSRTDDRFFRMWSYYLLSCAGSFRARRNQLWQIVFSKHGVPDGYASIR